ncbi:hypothetical protein ACFRCG_33200 [Embleya sp. NPDC056575]|uniref:hypothetical protein n=1 Tax=unclassified Embleya TaxID=2699296 RepID=UPI0036AE7C96
MTARRPALALTSALAAIALLFSGGTASAGTSEYYKTFTANANYLTKTDANGVLNAQVTWSSVNKPLAWSFDMSPALERTATGDMNCSASVPSFPDYHDGHPGIPVDYKWHSSIPGPHRTNTSYWYVLKARCTFPSKVNSTRGTTTVDVRLNYKMSTTAAAAAAASGSVNDSTYTSWSSFSPSPIQP